MTRYIPRILVKKILSSASNRILDMRPAKLTIMFVDIEV